METIIRKSIVFLATAWGPRLGGINSFNMDLAVAIAALLGSSYDVYCVVLEYVNGDIENAKELGVELLPLNVADDRYDEHRAFETWEKLRVKKSDINVEWWVGHDVISGVAANALPEIAGQGRSAVINHMSYIDYCAYKEGVGAVAQKKHQQQENVFLKADKLFAVGPLLRDTLTDLMPKEDVTMLIPGLIPNIDAQPRKTFSAITFGRLDPENDKIKQSILALSAFSSALCSADKEDAYPECLRKNPRMYLYGISESGGEEERYLKLHAQKIAGKAINLISLPFTSDRQELFKELSKASVALMLSWHEGFGLTGWEAISAEVPLIISENSGLYEFIEETLHGAGVGCLYSVRIKGDFGDDDNLNYKDDTLTEVKDLILKCANKIERARKNAKLLKEQLIEKGYTWDYTARSFAEALNLESGTIDIFSIGQKQNEEKTIGDQKIVSDDFNRNHDLINYLNSKIKKQQATIDFLNKDVNDNKLLSLMRQVVCYNQGEYAQYSFLAGYIHNRLETDDAPMSSVSLSDFLNRYITRVSRNNFIFLKKYFHGRNAVEPRFCIKGSIRREASDNIVEIVRDRQVNYFSEYPLDANSAFTFVKAKGTYFLCNDIPKSVAEGTYLNSRIDLEAARCYVKASVGNKKANDHILDDEWVKCWYKPERVDGGTSELNDLSCYKSTLIVPLTLWNVGLDEMFRDTIRVENVGRTIFGYLCLDHTCINYFTSADIDVGYIFADLLSLYLITRATYTEYSNVFTEKQN